MTTTYNNLITFLVDDHKFVLNKDTFNNHPDSLLTKIIKNETKDPSIIQDKLNRSIYYVDKDPESFRYIIDHLRGYTIQLDNIKDINLRNKVHHDMKYYNLPLNIIHLNIKLSPDLTVVDDIDTILNSTDKKYNKKDTPLLNQFEKILTDQNHNYQTESNNNLKELVNTFIQNDGNIPMSLMTDISNNPELKQLIMKFNQDTKTESDTESLTMDSTD